MPLIIQLISLITPDAVVELSSKFNGAPAQAKLVKLKDAIGCRNTVTVSCLLLMHPFELETVKVTGKSPSC